MIAVTVMRSASPHPHATSAPAEPALCEAA
jgi:hypothetical protein